MPCDASTSQDRLGDTCSAPQTVCYKDKASKADLDHTLRAPHRVATLPTGHSLCICMHTRMQNLPELRRMRLQTGGGCNPTPAAPIV